LKIDKLTKPNRFFTELRRFLLGAFVVENRPRLLSFWMTGEGARKMETLPIEQVQHGGGKKYHDFRVLPYYGILKKSLNRI
jgi:hypothetical protein